MVKVVVNPGRKVWDRENRREAKEGEVVEVKPVEATILKYRGHASDALPAAVAPELTPQPSQPPTPLPPVAEVPPVEAPAQLVEVPVENKGDEQPLRRGTYRRRDLRPEN